MKKTVYDRPKLERLESRAGRLSLISGDLHRRRADALGERNLAEQRLADVDRRLRGQPPREKRRERQICEANANEARELVARLDREIAQLAPEVRAARDLFEACVKELEGLGVRVKLAPPASTYMPAGVTVVGRGA